MIQVEIKKNKQNEILFVKCSGHAMYDDYGKDIVCAAVSTAMITSINAILKLEEKSIKVTQKESYLKIEVIHSTNITNALLENLEDSLSDIAKNYKENLEIKEGRVE